MYEKNSNKQLICYMVLAYIFIIFFIGVILYLQCNNLYFYASFELVYLLPSLHCPYILDFLGAKSFSCMYQAIIVCIG